MAQSTVKLIVDAQNAIRPLQRVNEQTKALSNSTNKLKGSLDKGNRSLRNTGSAAKAASGGVATLTKAFAPLLAAVSVLGAARFVFVKTAELETQRKSLEVLTGSIEKTNTIIQELQDFGAVTPFTSSELIEQTKRLKAFGFETEELVDTTKRLSEVAGATGADLTGIATAFGQIRAKGKLQQEENLQLLERGVDITTELKRITGLQGDAFEKAQRQGKIGADLVNQALINLTNEGGAFFGGATAQAETLNGLFSTLQDSIETVARTVGTELEDEIKSVLNFSIQAVKAVDKLIKNFDTLKKAIDVINPFEQIRSLQKQFDERFGKEKEINETFVGRPAIQNKIINKDQTLIKNLEDQITASDAINQRFSANVDLINSANTGLLIQNQQADKLKDKFDQVGQSVEQNLVQSLTDAVIGANTLGEALSNVLRSLQRQLIEIAVQQAVSGIGGLFSNVLGSAFSGGSNFIEGGFDTSFDTSLLKFANGGRPPVGRASIVGERGPELFVPRTAGTIIPNNAIGGGNTTNNMITVNVDASGTSVQGNGSEADQLGGLIASIVQATIIDESRAGGLLNR